MIRNSGKLRLRFLGKNAADTGKPGVVLIQKLLVPGIRRHAFQNHPVLFQHVPVQGFEPVAVHELPYVALPPRNLAGAPEKDSAVFFIDRRHETHDAEIAAGSCFLSIRQGRHPQPERTGVAVFDPVEIDVALIGFAEYESGIGLVDLHLGLCIALGHGMRNRMQISAMHRVHHVIHRIGPVALPVRGTQHCRPFVGMKLLRKVEFVGLLVQLVAEPDEDAVHVFEAGIGFHHLVADHGTFGYGGDILDDTVAANLHAVIPAGDAVAEVPAHRQSRTTVGTTVFNAMNRAILVAPDNDLFAKPRQALRLVCHHPACRDRPPPIERPQRHALFDILGIYFGISHLTLLR